MRRQHKSRINSAVIKGLTPFGRSFDGTLGADATFTRATTATVEDHEGVIREVLSGEARFQGQRRVYNLAASTDTPSTQGITVISGRVYQISIGADSASGATAILTGATTGTLTGDAANGQSFDTAKTATTTTLTITISGSVKNLQVEDVTGQTVPFIVVFSIKLFYVLCFVVVECLLHERLFLLMFLFLVSI